MLARFSIRTRLWGLIGIAVLGLLLAIIVALRLANNSQTAIAEIAPASPHPADLTARSGRAIHSPAANRPVPAPATEHRVACDELRLPAPGFRCRVAPAPPA